MKNITIVVIVLVLATAVTLFLVGANDDRRAPASGAGQGNPSAPRTADTGSDANDAPPPSEPTADPARVPVDESDGGGSEEGDESSATPLSEKQRELRSILTSLRDERTSASEQSKLWRRLGELGLADEVIAALLAELEDAPLDSHLHTMLGNAYITKMRSENLGPAERRAASQSAMGSFDKALEIDPRNWTARFSRAMSNSNAPAFLGLQKGAIEDFETLLVQQKESAFSEDHAHTYVFLGNLHEGAGNTDRAEELRSEARTLFPNDPRFRDR